jgi:glycosyltransferase involved in cell wall biosynthesis
MFKVAYFELESQATGPGNSLIVLIDGLPDRYRPVVALPSGQGSMAQQLGRMGVEVFPLESLRIARGRHLASFRQIAHTLVRIIETLWKVIRLLRRLRADLVHVNSSINPWPVLVGRLLSRTQVVCHVREVPKASLLAHRMYYSLLGMLSHHLIAVSIYVRSSLLQCNVPQKRVSVVYNGINTHVFQRSNHDRERLRHLLEVDDGVVLGNVGQLVEWKGQDIILEVLARLLAKHQPVYLVLVGDSLSGDSTFHDFLLRKAENLSCGSRIRALGARNDVPAVMSAFDVFVHLPRDPDPFPRVVLEAMSCSLPVVASEVGGIPEQVVDGECGFLVPPNELDVAEHFLERLVRSQELRREMGARGRVRVLDRFSAARHAREVCQVYDGLL